MPTKIQWADTTEGAVKIMVDGEMKGYHCTKVSEGCVRCYSERMNLNTYFSFANGIPYDNREVEFALDQKVLDRVMKYRKPRRVFWESMGDLFHEGIPDEFIDCVLAVAALTRHHQHLFLTKRPERMRDYFSASYGEFCQRLNEASREIHGAKSGDSFPVIMPTQRHGMVKGEPWPLPNVWLGVTAENQARADERIPVLLSIPAAVRFVSIEPMLGPVDLKLNITGATQGMCQAMECRADNLKWVILGAETGPGRRTMLPRWAFDVRDQCVTAGVPFFLKQMYRNDGTLWKLPYLDGEVWNEYPRG